MARVERELAVIRGGMEEVAEAFRVRQGTAGEGEGRAQRLAGRGRRLFALTGSGASRFGPPVTPPAHGRSSRGTRARPGGNRRWPCSRARRAPPGRSAARHALRLERRAGHHHRSQLLLAVGEPLLHRLVRELDLPALELGSSTPSGSNSERMCSSSPHRDGGFSSGGGGGMWTRLSGTSGRWFRRASMRRLPRRRRAS